MQKKKSWKSKIKLSNLLRLTYRNTIVVSTEDKEKAEWFIEERRKFLSAIEKKRDKTIHHIETLTSKLSEHNNYVIAQNDKFRYFENQCNEVASQIERLSKLLVAA